MSVEVQEVSSHRELMEFIKFPYTLYRDNPCHVPRLLMERKQFFSDENPIFRFTRVRYLLARDGAGRAVGRVTGHVNERHNEFSGERTGFFGFFESIGDAAVAAALMGEVERWLRDQGMRTVRGPFNFSTNQECGFLADRFDKPPAFMMPYTQPCYLEFMEELGYGVVRRLLAYRYEYEGHIPPHLVRFSERARDRCPATVRALDMRHFEDDVRRAFTVYNRAWSQNWGFVPMTEAQFEHTAHNLRAVVDPQLALIAEAKDQPVGFFLALPDLNEVLEKMNGRLFPFGILRFLFGRRRVKGVRVLIMGVVEEFRRLGVDAVLVHRAFQNGARRGYQWAEMSWILEENEMLRHALDRLGASLDKTYHLYEKSLCESS